MSRTRTCITLILAAAAIASLGGCKTSQYEDALRDPSPDDVTLTQNHTQLMNNMAHTLDTNERQLLDDMNRFWLFDRPTRLTPNSVR